MPARKTIAERSAQATQQRRRLALYVLGAVPVAILLVIGGVFLYQRATGLGPNEMPSSISQGDRDDIRAAVERFYNGVNQYNPQIAAETMLSLDDVGRMNMQRLILEVSALQGGELTFEVQSLGATTLDEAAGLVSARVATNYGPRDFVLTRRDGQWRVAKTPDLIVSQDHWPTKLSWEITNHYFSDDGNTLFVVGNMKNVGEVPGYMMTVGSFITDEQGETLQFNRPPIAGSPFLDPGDETPFLVTLGQAQGLQFDPSRVVIVPDFREVPPGSADAFKKPFEIEPPRVTWQDGPMTYTITNRAEKDYPIAIYGYFRDAGGKLLAVALVGGGTVPVGTSQPGNFDRDHLSAPSELPDSVSGIASVDLVAVQTSN